MEIREEGEVTLVLIDPRLDSVTSKEAEAKLMESAGGSSRRILCDFSNTDYISSAGLRVMLSTVKKLQKNGGKMVLSSMKPFVYSVFEMAGFTQIFEICETKAQALAHLNRASR